MTPTPHNSARKGEIAPTVLMPGDPLRSKFIAENFLENPVLFNNIRGIQGYTGTYKGVPVSVMASGMGIPSISLYSWELFSFYDVENIIRVGTAGGLQDDLQLQDVVAAMGSSTDSNYFDHFGLEGSFCALADYDLLCCAAEAAKDHGVTMKAGNFLSSDVFYADKPHPYDRWKEMGILAVEMESAGLYANAARLHKRALTICTITDHLYTGACLGADERRTTVNRMIEIALDTAVKIAEKK